MSIDSLSGPDDPFPSMQNFANRDIFCYASGYCAEPEAVLSGENSKAVDLLARYFGKNVPSELSAAVSSGILKITPLFDMNVSVECFSDDALELILNPRMSGFANICELVLNEDELDLNDFVLARIAGCSSLSRLKALRAVASGVTDKGLNFVLDSINMTNLEELELKDSEISDVGAGDLASSSRLSYFSKLDFSGSLITENGAQALLESFFGQRNAEFIFDDDKFPEIKKLRSKVRGAFNDCGL